MPPLPLRAPIVLYGYAQPTFETTGNVESIALYAGCSVGSVRQREPAADIVRSIAHGL
jgi:hypothetical protein